MAKLKRRDASLVPQLTSLSALDSTLSSEQAARRRRSYRVRFKLSARFWRSAVLKRARSLLTMSTKTGTAETQSPFPRSGTPAPGMMNAQMAQAIVRSLSPRSSADRCGSTPTLQAAEQGDANSSNVETKPTARAAEALVPLSTTLLQTQSAPSPLSGSSDDLRTQLQQANMTIKMLQGKVESEEALIDSMRRQIKSLDLTVQAANGRYLESLAEIRSLRRKGVSPSPVEEKDAFHLPRRNFPSMRNRAQSLPPVARSAKQAQSSKLPSKYMAPVSPPSKHKKSASDPAFARLQREDYGVKPGTRTRPATTDLSTPHLPSPWDADAQKTLTDSINELLQPQSVGVSHARKMSRESTFYDSGIDDSSSTVSCSPVQTPQQEKFFDVPSFKMRAMSIDSEVYSGLGITLPSPTLTKTSSDALRACQPTISTYQSPRYRAPVPSISPTPSSVYSCLPELREEGEVSSLARVSIRSPRPDLPLKSAKRLPKSPRAMTLSPDPTKIRA